MLTTVNNFKIDNGILQSLRILGLLLVLDRKLQIYLV